MNGIVSHICSCPLGFALSVVVEWFLAELVYQTIPMPDQETLCTVFFGKFWYSVLQVFFFNFFPVFLMVFLIFFQSRGNGR